MTQGLDGYELIGEVRLNALCDYVYADDNPVDQYIDKYTNDVNGVTTLCFAVGVADSILTSPIGGAISFVVCEAVGVSGAVTCAAEDVIRNAISCDDIVIDVYMAEGLNSANTVYPGYLLIDCQDGRVEETVENLANTAANYESDAIKTGEDLVDKTIKAGDNIVDGAQKFIDANI